MKPNFILKSFWLILIMLSVGVYSNASEGAKPSSMMELPPCELETTLASYNWYVYYTFDAGDGAYLLQTGDSIIRYQFNPNFSVGQYYLQTSGGFLVDDYTYDWSVNADCALVLTTSFGTEYTGVPYGEGFVFPGLSNMALLPMTPTVPGCTDPAAPNYWPSAIVDDGSCLGENITAFEAQRALDHDWYFTNTCGNFVANFEAYLYFQTVEYNYGFQNGSRTVVFDTDYSAEIYASETGNGWRTEYYFPTSLVTATFGNWFVHNWSLNDPGLIDLPSTLSFKINATGDTLTSLSGCWQVVKNPFGCTDPSAVNYRAAASVDNGTCYYAITEAQLTAEPWAATADAMYELPIFSSVITNTDAASKVRDYMAYASSADSATVMTFNADYTGLLNWKPSVVGAPSDYSNQYQYGFTWTLVDGKITVDFGYSLSPAPVDMYIDSNNQLVVMAHSVYAIFSNDNKIAAPTRTYFGSRFTQGNSLACSVTGACNYNPDDFLNPNTFPFDGLCTFPESIEGYDCTGCTVTEEVSGAYDVYVVGFGPTGQTLTLDGGINFNVGTAVQPLNADSRGGTATGTFLTAGQSWVQTCGRIDFLSNSGGYFNSGSLTYDATNGYWSGSSFSTSNPSNQGQQIIVVPAGSTIGCSNPNACNYDPSADVLVSIGCEMPMIGRDCDGNCIVTLDIAGTVWDSYEATNGPGGLVIGNMLTAGVLNFDASGNELGENFGTGMTWSQNCAIVSITNGTNTYNLFLVDSYTLVYQNWNPVTFQVELQVFKLPFVEVLGCIDNTACNFDASANTDDGSCTYANPYEDCSGNCLNDTNNNGTCDELELAGCTDNTACNYDAAATIDDSSCTYANPYEDCSGNCLNDTNNNGTCDELELAGCTDNTACNYVSTATLEDGSCTYANPYEDCSGNCLNDTNNNGTCDELEVSGCTDSFACNYDATATLDNGSCVYQSLVYYVDNDGDGYGAGDPGLYCSNPGAGYSTNGTDCNDGNAAIHPNAPEICGNNIDNDCDGQIDENCGGNGPANDERQNATTVNPTQYPFCSNTSGTCLNANGNDVWYQFVAQTQAARIAVTSVLNNVVLSVENEAGDQVLVSEDETAVGQEIAIAGGLTPGSIYFIRIENVNVATAGNFVMCVQHIPMSDPDNGTSFDNLCGYIKADWTGAQLYSATFTDASNNEYTGSSAQTFLPFSTFGGLQYGQTYSVVFNCTYILNDAGGNPNTVVTTSPAYTITIAEPASIALRSSDRCPTTRNIGSFIGTDRAICGATGYEWEFTLADEFGNAISLESIVVAVNTNSRYIRTTSISGVQPGDHYLVRVRPLFSYGPGSYGSSQMLCIAGSAGMTTEGDNATPSLTGVNAERSVKLYPNPNNGEMINIQLTGVTSETVQVNVIDALGRVIVSNQYSVNNTFNGTILFDTKLSSGMYNVQIIDGEAVMTERVIIK